MKDEDMVFDSDVEEEDQEFRDTFLPQKNDRLKADIKRLRRQLAEGTEKIQSLRRQIIEEDISQIVVSKITQVIKDPSQIQPEQLEGIQKDIFDEMMEAIYQCSVKEIVSYYRLTGITSYTFKEMFVGYRLETFYKKRYNKSYYVLFHKSNLTKLRGHTLPPVVPIDILSEKLLPDNLEAFVRNVHVFIQAYVYRSELVKEIEQAEQETKQIRIISKDQAVFNLELFVISSDGTRLKIRIQYGSLSSRFPTKVAISTKRKGKEVFAFEELETLFMEDDIMEVLRSIT